MINFTISIAADNLHSDVSIDERLATDVKIRRSIKELRTNEKIPFKDSFNSNVNFRLEASSDSHKEHFSSIGNMASNGGTTAQAFSKKSKHDPGMIEHLTKTKLNSNEISSEESDDESFEELITDNEHGHSLSCVDCDSRIIGNRCFQIDVLESVRTCHSEIGQCYTAILNGEVLRGCVGDVIFSDINSINLSENSIELCNNNHFCNQKDIEDSCYVVMMTNV